MLSLESYSVKVRLVGDSPAVVPLRRVFHQGNDKNLNPNQSSTTGPVYVTGTAFNIG